MSRRTLQYRCPPPLTQTGTIKYALRNFIRLVAAGGAPSTRPIILSADGIGLHQEVDVDPSSLAITGLVGVRDASSLPLDRSAQALSEWAKRARFVSEAWVVCASDVHAQLVMPIAVFYSQGTVKLCCVCVRVCVCVCVCVCEPFETILN